jgi:hypothetical protein
VDARERLDEHIHPVHPTAAAVPQPK